MGGQIIYRKPQKPPTPPPAPPHFCTDKPYIGDMNPGDIWLCDCGRKWRIKVDDEDARKIWVRHFRPLWFKRLENNDG